MTRIAYITNVCSHYRVGLYERLAFQEDIDFYFFSEGKEWYAESKNDLSLGKFKAIPLVNFPWLRIFNMNLDLPKRLWHGKYDIFVKCINGKWALSTTYLIARMTGKPFVLVTGLWMHPKSLIHRLSFPFVRYIYRHADAVIVYGDHVKQYLVEAGTDPKKIFVGYLAVQNELFNVPVSIRERGDLRAKLGIASGKVILFVGRLSQEKGLNYLIEAYHRVKESIDATLVIVGDGACKKELMEAESADRGVHFVDYVPNPELYRYYAIADVFVLPSVTTDMVKETWGLVINEAMNQGCPIVASDAVGAAVGGLLQDGKTGFIVPEGNSERLAASIRQILTNDTLRASVRQYVQTRIQKWDYDQMTRGYLDAIRSVGSP